MRRPSRPLPPALVSTCPKRQVLRSGLCVLLALGVSLPARATPPSEPATPPVAEAPPPAPIAGDAIVSPAPEGPVTSAPAEASLSERQAEARRVFRLREYLEQGHISNAVNFPSVTMSRESAYRVAIANANVPNMLGQISTAMAQAGLNIHNMVNKSRGDMAYTLVDVESPVGEPVLAALRGIDGVLAVCYLPQP